MGRKILNYIHTVMRFEKERRNHENNCHCKFCCQKLSGNTSNSTLQFSNLRGRDIRTIRNQWRWKNYLDENDTWITTN